MTKTSAAAPTRVGSAGGNLHAVPIALYPVPVVPRTAEQAAWNMRAAVHMTGAGA